MAPGREQRLSARKGKPVDDALNNLMTPTPSAGTVPDAAGSLLKNSNLFSSFVVKNKLQAGVPKKGGAAPGWQLVLKTALSSLQKEEVPATLCLLGDHVFSKGKWQWRRSGADLISTTRFLSA